VSPERYVQIKELVGKTLTLAQVERGSLYLNADDGSTYLLEGDDDCSNSPASVEDVCGDLSDLIGSPLLVAEEINNDDSSKPLPEVHDAQESQTWSFYKFATIKGRVTVRFFGSSNGYYSETASLHRMKEATK
jgi:hypothetical protein